MADCKHLLQQRITTRKQNAVFAQSATVTDDVSKLGHTSVTLVDLGVKVDGTYYNSCCLPYVMSLASLYFKQEMFRM